MDFKDLDKKARTMAQSYLRLEGELLLVIIEIDKSKAFYKLGFNSLFSYVNQALKLSPAITCSFIKVARKSHEVPELKKQVTAGKLSISKAQKMTSVLTKENKQHWLKLAQTTTHRELERAVALSSPTEAIRERARYTHPFQGIEEKVKVKTSVPRIELQVGLSEKLMIQLRRAQDLESSRLKKSLNLEQTLENILEVYLDKKDPVRKATRQKVKGKLTHVSEKDGDKKHSSREQHCSQKALEKKNSRPNQKRKLIPSQVIHQIQLRDQGQCTHKETTGKRCSARRYLEVHHIKPVARGGDNQLENLSLLCSGHHKVCHQKFNLMEEHGVARKTI